MICSLIFFHPSWNVVVETTALGLLCIQSGRFSSCKYAVVYSFVPGGGMYVPSKIFWQIFDVPSYPISSAKAPYITGVSLVCVNFSCFRHDKRVLFLLSY